MDTDYRYDTEAGQNSHTDPEGAPTLGSGNGAPSNPRARRSPRTKAKWAELLDNPFVRAQAAAQLGIRVEHLSAAGAQGAEQAANDATADMLDDLITALREEN